MMGCQGWGNRLYIGISGELEALLGPGFLSEVDTYVSWGSSWAPAFSEVPQVILVCSKV